MHFSVGLAQALSVKTGINEFTVTFDLYNAFLLNKGFDFFLSFFLSFSLLITRPQTLEH